MRQLLWTCVALLVAACGSSGGTKVDQNQVAQFQRGVTTYDQVVSAFGQPQVVSKTADGHTVIAYAYTQTQVRGATFIPVVGLFAGGADANQQSESFTFDKNGILQDYTTMQSQACSGNGVMSNVNAANCQSK